MDWFNVAADADDVDDADMQRLRVHRDLVEAKFDEFAKIERASQLENLRVFSKAPWEDMEMLAGQDTQRIKASIARMTDYCIEGAATQWAAYGEVEPKLVEFHRQRIHVCCIDIILKSKGKTTKQ